MNKIRIVADNGQISIKLPADKLPTMLDVFSEDWLTFGAEAEDLEAIVDAMVAEERW